MHDPFERLRWIVVLVLGYVVWFAVHAPSVHAQEPEAGVVVLRAVVGEVYVHRGDRSAVRAAVRRGT